MARRWARGRPRFRREPGSASSGLFDKVPARRKFLRSPRAEYAACLDAVKRLAMARSDVAFALEHDGRRILSLQPADAAGAGRGAAQRTSSTATASASTATATACGLTGVVSLPTFNRGMADQQFLFVNARPVKDRLLVGALRAAYRDLIARDRHPIAALFLDGAARRGRHQRPPGQDRGPLPRPGGRARPDRRRPPRRARRGGPAQRGARAGRQRRCMWTTERHPTTPISNRVPAAVSDSLTAGSGFRGSDVAESPRLVRPRTGRPRRAGGRAGAQLSRSASRAGRSPRPTSSPRPRTGW